jgi:hypothetical protein
MHHVASDGAREHMLALLGEDHLFEEEKSETSRSGKLWLYLRFFINTYAISIIIRHIKERLEF